MMVTARPSVSTVSTSSFSAATKSAASDSRTELASFSSDSLEAAVAPMVATSDSMLETVPVASSMVAL